MWNPSYDFRMFDLPNFSPLQAQEFGVETIFGANDPPWFVDLSMFNLFQGAEDARERARRLRDEAQRVYEDLGGDAGKSSECKEGRNILGRCGPIIGSGPNRPGDASVGDDPTKSGQKVGGLVEKGRELFKAIPGGGGTFLLAVIALIFLLLFVRR